MKNFVALSATAMLLGTAAFGAEPMLPAFSAAEFSAGDAIDNPYLPMPIGGRVHISADYSEDGETLTEESVQRVDGPGPVILGVETIQVTDTATDGGLVVEVARDYYAQDRSGNVWYFGEDVVNYLYDDEGVQTGTNTEGSWMAGRNGALPGIVMPAAFTLGEVFFQEHAPAEEAMDTGRVIATGLTLEVGGKSFTDVVKILDGSTIDPDAREFKYYAPGFGLIRAEEGLSPAFDNPELVVDRIWD
jgi:hypothetical protein